MLKRKREDGDRGQSRQKKDIHEIIVSSQKKLHRALKTAKGFERQKLGKRLKNASSAGNPGEVSRINREISVLKDLDITRAGNAYLCKTLLKIKAFAESQLLQKEVKEGFEAPRAGMAEEDKLALGNVTSGMFNMKAVKEAMGEIVKEMYPALGIPRPAKPTKAKRERKKKDHSQENLKCVTATEKAEASDGALGKQLSEEVDWEGFEDDETVSEGGENVVEIDDEILSKYNELLGGSSDEESFDEEVYKANGKSPASNRLSLSLSPSPSDSDSNEESMSESRSSSPPRKHSKVSKAPIEPPKASIFLPSLMGGYWSGSESSASDLEDDIPQVRKNRPGQMARRAIFEKKFGAKANHIQKGLPPVGTPKDDGWDAKRGATDGKRGRGRGKGGFGDRAEGRQREARESRQATGDNAMPVGERKNKRDDTGKLHASWEAAKKAKLEQKTATFAGKKIVFD